MNCWLLFLRNPRIVLTRGLLMDRIWGNDFEGGPNVLEVYIGHLRNKLEQMAKNASSRPYAARAMSCVLQNSEEA